jgi:hypothetical protein
MHGESPTDAFSIIIGSLFICKRSDYLFHSVKNLVAASAIENDISAVRVGNINGKGKYLVFEFGKKRCNNPCVVRSYADDIIVFFKMCSAKLFGSVVDLNAKLPKGNERVFRNIFAVRCRDACGRSNKTLWGVFVKNSLCHGTSAGVARADE